jgi:uncharacterized membrane protein
LIQIAHIGFFLACIFASFSKNRLVWKTGLTAKDIVRVRMFDKISASAAGLLALSGLAMLFWFARPSSAYLENSLFWIKMALFIIASALVIWTKIDFKKALADDQPLWSPPSRVRAILAFDLMGLFVLAALGRWLAAGHF